MSRKHIITLILLFLPMVNLLAADAKEAAERLAALGFENVRVAEKGDQVVFAAFESVSYRGTYRGA